MKIIDLFVNKINKIFSKLDKKEIVYLVSYPKSGNTWLRFIIGNYFTNGKINFSNYHKVIPDIHRNPQDIDNAISNPTFVKSHFSFRKDYKRVVYIYRDGRDVSVSYYHQLKGKDKIPHDLDFKGFFWDFFMKGNFVFGDWGDHVVSWKKKSGQILFIRYEDLKENTFKELCKIFNFCKVPIDDNRLIKAIKLSSKENMAKDEIKNRQMSLEHKDAVSENFKFVRKGVVGDWVNWYDQEMTQAFDKKYGKIMTKLQYK